MSEEQRAHPRQGLIALNAMVFDSVRVASGALYDISAGGAFVVSDAVPLHGARVELHGSYRGRGFVIESTVRWVGHSAKHDCDGFGVQWERLPVALDDALAA